MFVYYRQKVRHATSDSVLVIFISSEYFTLPIPNLLQVNGGYTFQSTEDRRIYDGEKKIKLRSDGNDNISHLLISKDFCIH